MWAQMQALFCRNAVTFDAGELLGWLYTMGGCQRKEKAGLHFRHEWKHESNAANRLLLAISAAVLAVDLMVAFTFKRSYKRTQKSDFAHKQSRLFCYANGGNTSSSSSFMAAVGFLAR